MKRRILSLLTLTLLLGSLLTAPALAEDQNVTLPSSYDEVIGVLLDGAPHMSFVATQTQVKFQVSEELRGKPLRVYDFRSAINFLYRNVEDVTPDAEGYVTLNLPSTGDFVVADLPYEVSRIVLDLRYMDKSVWPDCKTPSKPFDTDLYPIPDGEWVSSVDWRKQEGLEPFAAAESADAEPTDEEAPAAEDPAGGQSAAEPAGDGKITVPPTPVRPAEPDAVEAALPITPPELPATELPWVTYLVVAVFIGVGALISVFLRSR